MAALPNPIADLQARIAEALDSGWRLPRVGPDAELERARIYGSWVLAQLDKLRADLGVAR